MSMGSAGERRLLANNDYEPVMRSHYLRLAQAEEAR